jgi:hypothetical protein
MLVLVFIASGSSHNPVLLVTYRLQHDKAG